MTHDSTYFSEVVNQSVDIVIYFNNMGIPAPQNPDASKPWNLRPPGHHRSVMVSQGKGRGHMHIPSPGVIRNSGPYLDQALDQPVSGPLNFFAPDIELPDHVQEVVSQNSHFQTGVVSLKSLA